jgi:signal transduction histidine kinase/DNA-binding response OmpR family regulator
VTRVRRRYPLLLLFLLCLSVSAQRSRVLRVPHSYRTIQSAVDAARVGDTVLVGHGVYYENVSIRKNIVIGSLYLVDGDLAHRELTIIDGSRARDKRKGSTITISGSCDTTCVIVGLTIQGGTGTIQTVAEAPPFDRWVSGGGVFVNHSGARVAHNVITHNAVSPVGEVNNCDGGGILAVDTTGGRALPPPIIVEHNTIVGNDIRGRWCEAAGIGVAQPGTIRNNVIMYNVARAQHRSPGGGIGVWFTNDYDITIDRNYIRANVASIAGGVVIGTPGTRRGRAILTNNIIAENISSEVGGAVNVAERSWAFFLNNTIVGNRAGSAASAIYIAAEANATFVNNIIWGDPSHIISSFSDIRMFHNLICGGYPGESNTSSNPGFAPGDTLFRLSDTSPAIGLGTSRIDVAGTEYHVPSKDLLGALRPSPPASEPDLGATESPLARTPASTSILEDWQASNERYLKLTLHLRQITPTEMSHDRSEVVQAGRMEVTLSVNDTSTRSFGPDDPLPVFTLPPGRNLLEVEVVTTGVEAGRLPARIRLHGFEVTSHRMPSTYRYGFRQYVDLPPRSYQLQISVSDEMGIMDRANVRTLGVVVPAYWYQRWWAYALYGGLVLVGAVVMVRIRIRRLRLLQDLQLEHLEREKLTGVDRLKSQFFANISHELRTPLTLIQGPVDDLLATATDPGVRERLSLIRRNAEKLLKLIDQLLHFTRVESGNARLEVARQEIVAILRRACDAFASRAERKGIRFRFTSTSAEIHGWLDAEKLEHIVENLVSNAIKFTASGGQVNILATVEQAELTVVVEDTGSGIEAQHLPHVFERFYRADKTHKVEGTGIGLSLTKELVELHRGRIKIDSEPGIGTTVTVTIPLEGYLKSEMVEALVREDAATTRPTTDVPISPPVSGQPGDRPTVLVVEDNDDARAFIGSILNGNYDVHLAASGKEALGIAQHFVPDVVISDVMMPGMDGYELCRELKTNESTSHVPVILLTALADGGDRIEGLEHGADEYLTKPFDGQELQMRIRNLLRQREEIRKHYRRLVTLAPSPEQRLSMEDAFLQKVNASVLAHLADEQYGIEVLAQDVALSRTQVYRKLKALTDLAPVEYIRRLRLQRDKELLERHAGTVGEIAYQAGFSNASWFAKCYREEFGVAPSGTLKNGDR